MRKLILLAVAVLLLLSAFECEITTTNEWADIEAGYEKI